MKKYVFGYVDLVDNPSFTFLTVPKGKSWKVLATMYEGHLVTSSTGNLQFLSYGIPHFLINSLFTVPSDMPNFAQVVDNLTLSASATIDVLVYLYGLSAYKSYADTASASHYGLVPESNFGYLELLEDDAIYTSIAGYTSSNASGYLKYRYLIEELPLI